MPDYHEKVLKQMLKGNEDFHFCRQNSNTEEELSAVALNGVRVCICCKRFMCKRTTQYAKRDTTRNETDLECLLRHLRNSIAHGHVYVNQGGTYNSILFEDENKKHNITARIMCCQADLRKWRREIARIQTFPDDFVFIDDTPKDIIAMYKVIGNAVPCHLAEVIADSIYEQVFREETE